MFLLMFSLTFMIIECMFCSMWKLNFIVANGKINLFFLICGKLTFGLCTVNMLFYFLKNFSNFLKKNLHSENIQYHYFTYTLITMCACDFVPHLIYTQHSTAELFSPAVMLFVCIDKHLFSCLFCFSLISEVY